MSESGRLRSAYLRAGTSSFSDLLGEYEPQLLPNLAAEGSGPHGTTIVAIRHPGGVIMAGDRRATMGNLIASRDMTKVFTADDYSVIGIAGTAGVALEVVKLFRVELEHYEKIEGTTLSLDGKANRLAIMLRGNLGMALQGLAVVPLFAGFDLDRPDPASAGRIFSYDLTGGCYEEQDYAGVGSGSTFAKASLKKLYRPDLDSERAALALVHALYDAADEDSATGGPDMARRIFPVIIEVTAAGAQVFDEERTAALATRVVEQRTARPGGPLAEL